MYLVCYDVSDSQRLIRKYKKMLGYGDPVQYSVFMCDLNPKEVVVMRGDLENLLNLGEDRVLIADLGPVKNTNKNVLTLGPSIDRKREAAIVI